MPKLNSDFWEGVCCKDEEIVGPTWAQVEQAILQLNGAERTSVTLTLNDGSHICVGGGEGRFVVYVGTAVTEEEAYYTLVDPEEPEPAEVKLVTGGQLGIFPARLVVKQDKALQAVRRFFETGDRDAELPWADE